MDTSGGGVCVNAGFSIYSILLSSFRIFLPIAEECIRSKQLDPLAVQLESLAWKPKRPYAF